MKYNPNCPVHSDNFPYGGVCTCPEKGKPAAETTGVRCEGCDREQHVDDEGWESRNALDWCADCFDPNPTQENGLPEELVEARFDIHAAENIAAEWALRNEDAEVIASILARVREFLDDLPDALEQHFIERLTSPEAVEAAQRAISSRSLTYIAPRLMTKALQAAASTLRGGEDG